MTGLAAAIERADYLRRSPAAWGGAQGHKEWLHFCVYGSEVDVLVNFSVVDDVRAGAAAGTEFARLTMLVRTPTGWDGDVDGFVTGATKIRGGGIDMVFGPNQVVFRDGAYHITAALRDRAVSAHLVLRPSANPSLANNIQLDPGPPINWLVLPRLEATGEVTVDGKTYAFDRSAAYHDHNWGHFAWGRDFAWEWGFGLPHTPGNPWTLVFVRLSDRAHTKVRMQAVFLWRNAVQHRVLRAADVHIVREGYLRRKRVLKIPRVMGLVYPDLATDVPQRLHIEATGDGDTVRVTFDAEDLAQVVIPNDHHPGVTVINEVSGTVRVDGVVRGEPVQMEGRAIFEFLGR